jgi:transcription initiation factor TFIIB
MASREIYHKDFDEDVHTEKNQCPDCGGHVTTNAKETVCEDCGLVISEQPVDPGPEWREFNDEDQNERKRAGPPLTEGHHDRGLTTTIGHGTDGYGNRLSGKRRRQLTRMRRMHRQARHQSKAERNLEYGFKEVRRIAGALGMGDSVCDQAYRLFRSAQNEALLVGRSVEAVAAASIYGVCRCNGQTRLLAEIASLAQVSESRVANAYKTLNRELELPAKPMTPAMYVPRLVSELECSSDIEQQAVDLAEKAEDKGVISGVNPAGFAAACLYQVDREADRQLTQAQVADVSGVTSGAIRSYLVTIGEQIL